MIYSTHRRKADSPKVLGKEIYKMDTVLKTPHAPAAIGPYSQGRQKEGRLICISGQLPVDPETGEFAGEDIGAQTERSILNLQAVLKEAGADLSDVIKTTVFLADMNDFCGMNAVYSELFAKPFPARSAVEVARVPKGARVEIEAIAVV